MFLTFCFFVLGGAGGKVVLTKDEDASLSLPGMNRLTASHPQPDDDDEDDAYDLGKKLLFCLLK
jgi:hypothetical protein